MSQGADQYRLQQPGILASCGFQAAAGDWLVSAEGIRVFIHVAPPLQATIWQ